MTVHRLFAAILLVSVALPASGQGALRRLERAPRPLAPNATPQQRRQFLQQEVRRSFWRVTKERLGFTDEQMTRLEESSQRFDQRRRLLGQDEKAARLTLRTEMLADSAANQPAIASALDRLQSVQRQRVEILADEQKELGAFMTPLQRAKYLTLQDQVRKRLQQIVGTRPDSVAGRGGLLPIP